jgi:hypothetical protein
VPTMSWQDRRRSRQHIAFIDVRVPIVNKFRVRCRALGFTYNVQSIQFGDVHHSPAPVIR